MNAQQRRSRRPRHNNHARDTKPDRGYDSATSFDPFDIVACRLNLTSDGWFIDYIDVGDPECAADLQTSAVEASGPRRTPERDRQCLVLVIAVPHGEDGVHHDAVRAASIAARSAVRSLPESDELLIKLMVISPGTGRHG